jgi:repressor LexA
VHPRTKRQKEVLDFITGYMDRHGHEPSYQQIARHMGVSSRGGIQRHIAALENQGLIARKRDNGGFSLELSLRSVPSDSVSTVETIELANGDGFDPCRSMTPIPKFMLGSLMPDEVIAFKMPDDSMGEKGICEGDLVLMERRTYARRGEVALLLVGGRRAVFGIYHPQGLNVEVRTPDPDIEPLTFPAVDTAVQGVMRGLMRPIPRREDES